MLCNYSQKIYIRYYNMFQNSYQNGTFFEVFDPKISQDKAKNLYKLQNVQTNYKVFDKNLKTFIYEFLNTTSKIAFPKEDKKQLYLIQQFLIMQLEFTNSDWHIELTVSDLTRTKRRIILSPALHKVQKKPFFVKFPSPPIKQGSWVQLCIDLYSFIQGFKGQTYRSLDAIQIIGCMKLRRIFTTQHPTFSHQQSIYIQHNVLLPKNLSFPPEIQCQNYFIKFEDTHHEQSLEHTQSTSKSSSHIVSSKAIKKQAVSKKQITSKKQIREEKPKFYKEKQAPVLQSQSIKEMQIVNSKNNQKASKVQKQNTKIKDQKKFLANTNGLESLKSKKQMNKNEENSESSNQAITPLSTGKTLKRRRQPLSKTHISKQKRISIEKKTSDKPSMNPRESSISKKKAKQNQKINPWRSSTNKKNETGRYQPQKIEDQRKIQSAQATLFKTGNNLCGKQAEIKGRAFDKNSEISRQSDYFELSQKFSTVTEGRFFRNQLLIKNQDEQKTKEAHDEIQQNIQIETNSHYSNSNPNSNEKNKENLCAQLHQKPIEQSINDSLDLLTGKSNKPSFKDRLAQNESYLNMSSRNGFGEKMMNKFMKQLQRPYSPPLGEREHTQEQENETKQLNNENKGVQLIYDPVLNCYYDHKTHTYYELKN